MWTEQQLKQYNEQGVLRMPGLIDPDLIAELKAVSDSHIRRIAGEAGTSGDTEQRTHYVKELVGAVRTVFAMHREIEPARRVIRLPQISGPLKQIFGDDAYVFHSKLNVKDAFDGAVWLWHQDYGYWQYDGVDDRITSVMIMLDRTSIHSGCMLFVPGSHQWGVLEHHSDETTTSYKQWCVPVQVLRERLTSTDDLLAATGEPGDVWFFDCNILHGSGHNLAPSSRQALIFACAHIDNRAKGVDQPRPDWVVDREYENFTAEMTAPTAAT